MNKITWKAGTMLYPVPVVMVSCGDFENESNIITVAWTGTINSEPAMTYISVRPHRHSYNIIKDRGEFVINIVTEQLAFACDYCGVISGADVDKFDKTGLTKAKASCVKAPLIAESPVNIECKVKDVIHIGSHDMFMAEVMAVNVSENYVNKNGTLELEKSKPICYSHGKYYPLGQSIGKFGYSVEKKK